MDDPVSSLMSLVLAALMFLQALPSKEKVSLSLVRKPLSDALHDLQAQTEHGFSLEQPLQTSFGAQSPTDPLITLDLRDVPLSQALDAICEADGRYAWTIDGRTINIYPKSAQAQGDSYALNRSIPELRIENATRADRAVASVFAQIPPPTEQIAVMQLGGSTDLPKPLTLQTNNVVVRHALNVIAEQLCAKCGWSLAGTNKFRVITFHASFERLPPTPTQH